MRQFKMETDQDYKDFLDGKALRVADEISAEKYRQTQLVVNSVMYKIKDLERWIVALEEELYWKDKDQREGI